MRKPVKYPRLTVDQLNNTGMANLTEALAACHIRDWYDARAVAETNTDPDILKAAKKTMREAEDFLRSKRFYDITGLDGRRILRLLNERFDREYANARRRYNDPTANQ